MGKEVDKTVIHGSEVTNYDSLLWYAGKVTDKPRRHTKDEERFNTALFFFFPFFPCMGVEFQKSL